MLCNYFEEIKKICKGPYSVSSTILESGDKIEYKREILCSFPKILVFEHEKYNSIIWRPKGAPEGAPSPHLGGQKGLPGRIII